MEFIKRVTVGLAVKLLSLSGQRALLLHPEACGLILDPDNPTHIQCNLDMSTWERDETLGNAIMAGALSVIIRDHEQNLCLADAIYAACAESGFDRATASQVIRDLIGEGAVQGELPLVSEDDLPELAA